MCKIDFTFGVLAYNQADIICETLNSIKYQILNFGKHLNCRLVVTDDNSKDNTVEVLEKWISQNGYLFKQIIKKYNDKNQGVPSNYDFIMNQIHEECFKVIAADDLISSNDIFKKANSISPNTIYNGLPVYIKNNKIELNNNALRHQFWVMQKNMTHKRYIREFKLGKLLHTPSMLYSKKMYVDGKCRELNSQFKFFEDNPTWYCMFKNIPSLKLQFDEECLVLYRISERSISNRKKKDSVSEAFKNELYRLYKIYINEGDIFDKIYFSIKMNSFFEAIHFTTFLEKIKKFIILIYCILHRGKFNLFKEVANIELAKQIQFYENIKSESFI